MSTKDWLEKDYYKVLGVSKDASDKDIKKAFHKIARENHPDAHPGDKAAETRFKEASEAHQVLSDPSQRKEYDEARSMFGAGPFRFPRGGTQGFEHIFRAGDVDDGGLGDLLGGFFGGGGRRTSSRGPRRGRDVEGEVTIDFLQSVEGTSVSMQMTSDAACSACHGTGAKVGSVPRVCSTCQGSGMQTSTTGGVFAVSEPCRDCRGRGMVVDDPCPECAGTGRAQSARSMTVRIPAGVTDGQRIRIKGKGGAGENGGAAGDLYVVVHVTPHGSFGRRGDALTITVPVTIAEATLGAEISVPTLQGLPVRMKVPAGTANGRVLRVRDKGVARPDGSHGDLLVTIEIAVPPTINDEARQAMEAYAAATADFQPRATLGH